MDVSQTIKGLFHSAVDAICAHRDGTIVVANPAFARLFGYASADDMAGKRVLDTLAPEERERIGEFIRRRATGIDAPSFYAATGLRRDGSRFEMEVGASMFQGDGESFCVAVLRDISDAAAAKRHLVESEERFRNLFKLSPDPTWIIQDNRFVECNRAAVAILGYPDEDSLKNVHPSELSPEFQPDGEASFTKAERMMGLTMANGLHRFEWTHKRRDGSLLPAEVTLSATLLQGKPSIYCSWRDISERHQAEAQMRLAAGVFDSTQEGIVVTDIDGTIVSVNPAFTRITGYAGCEVIGKTPAILKSHHQDQNFYRAMWADLRARGEWRGELWNRRKDGEAYLEWLTISAVNGPDGKPARFVAVFSDVTELRRKDDQIRHQAYHDALTGLPNRFLLGDRLDHAMEMARRTQAQVAVLFLDLDRFKIVNDSLGHHEGDKLLVEVARRIGQTVRKSDTVSRLGGDEFVVVLGTFSDSTEVALVAEKIIASLSKPLRLSGKAVHTGTSIGIAVFPQDGEDAATLLKNADTAMYQAKAAGRSCFRFFDRSMNALAVRRLELEAQLRQAMEAGQLELHYQPKVVVETGALAGLEALLRWNHPEQGWIPPMEFIPLAEESGLIIPLSYWVVEEACRHLAQWRKAGIQAKVAINLSARQFHDDKLPQRIEAILQRCKVPGSALEIELTEGSVMDEPRRAIVILQRLRALGLRISLDDFGTGYSSLAYLKRFPISTVKIDRSFVMDLPDDPEDAAIVRAILDLARGLNLDVVAEGVETAEQMEFLRAAGCGQIQGYYFSPPLPAAELGEWLRKKP
ncbi:Putative PAS domain S-box/diguanylate cyclase (GGDEF) domain-containing protein(Diguanylate phosphodiesterase, EAL domain,5451-796) [Magnetospirillum sp. XM-1]|uniref:sensor domain-containing protein n=1 Tax=Magnetospirillum sp. XM-1 TaxID=1663591 RepID=UPI00073DC478|nr:EAL domain-containing protein [Magnetospirillum sp. XM-1]CUW38205.1 Putative PAS domain S-box/diguanylate cyclase (GGDEF) domain-containing protein(Diguanylate phosphodiesterase, EAL domain,5451-796) [Magnetospirillum sp. XM-1]